MVTLRIRWKVALLMSVTIVLSVGMQLAYYPQRQIADLTDALTNKAMSLSRVMGHQVAAPLEFEDGRAVREALEGLSIDTDVVYAALFNASGGVVAEIGADKLTVKLPLTKVEAATSSEVGDLLHVLVPVTSRGGVKGTLSAAYSTQSISLASRSVWQTTLLLGGLIIAVGLFLAITFGRRIGGQLERIATETERVAQGDLSRPNLDIRSQDEIGRMATAFDAMVRNQREIVGQIAQVSVQLNTQVGEFLATAQNQARGATEQSSAVEETRRTLDSLLESGREISRVASLVLENAERTQQTSGNMASRIVNLSKQIERIGEILEVIKGIASKSEILALNAALEGTKAGDAGRGFSLVATQMQRLAENVMEAVRDIRDLTGDIREATQASVLATEETNKLSIDTTKSTRQISLIIQQQQSGTDQVTTAMDDVVQIASHTAASSKQIVSASEEAQQLVGSLQSVVSRFRITAQ